MIWALPLFWLACATAGYVYGLQRGIPSSVVLAALPAFLLEATLFLTLGVETWRKKLEKLRPAGVAALLVLGAIAPYCAASLAFGSFRWQALAGIALLSGLVSFWYVVLPQKARRGSAAARADGGRGSGQGVRDAVRPSRPPLAARGTGASHVDPYRRLRAPERPPRARGRLRILAVASRMEDRRALLLAHAARGGRAGLGDRLGQVPPARRRPGSGPR